VEVDLPHPLQQYIPKTITVATIAITVFRIMPQEKMHSIKEIILIKIATPRIDNAKQTNLIKQLLAH
jgi:hypothetical protein